MYAFQKTTSRQESYASESDLLWRNPVRDSPYVDIGIAGFEVTLCKALPPTSSDRETGPLRLI